MRFRLPSFLSSPKPDPAVTALVDQLLAFVREIGLTVREEPLPRSTFLPGLLIDQGQLVVDRRRLLHPGDILHEAGHLAVIPAAERAQLNGAALEERSQHDGDELAALAWSYAATQALNLPPEVVFHPDGYKGQSAWLIDTYRSGRNMGQPLLFWMELTTAADYPRMHRWLRA